MRRLSLALKVGISAAILLFLFHKANLAQSLNHLNQLRYHFVLLSIVLIVAGQGVRALRLGVMVFGGEGRRRFWSMLRIQMVSFLPGVISPAKVGEVAKVYLMQSDLGVPAGRGLACFVAERVLDLALLGPLAAAGVFLFFRAGLQMRFGSGWVHATGVVLIAFVAALLLGIVWAHRRGISLIELWRTVSPKSILEAGALTLLYWGIVFAEVWCFCEASAVATGIWNISLIVPPALISSMIPISFSGFGLREAAMMILLQRPPISAGYNQALLISLMYDIIGLGIPVLMGILFWVTARRHGTPET